MSINLYVPSQTGSYNTAAGSVRIRLYDIATGAVDFDSPCKFDSPLQYDFYLQNDGKVRLSNLKLTFWNKNNIWETYGGSGVFAVATDAEKIFIDVILDGSVYWSGVIDYLNIVKKDYYDNAGNLNYQTITIPFVDKIKYLEKVTLSAAGIIDGDAVIDVMSKMATALDLVLYATYLSNYGWTELNGISYNLTGLYGQTALKITDLDSSENCLSLLKKIGVAFAFSFYNYSGNLVIQSRNMGFFLALDPITNDRAITKIEKKYPITYVAAKGTMDWTVLEEHIIGTLTPNFPDDDTRRFESGEKSENNKQNFVIDIGEILSKIYYDCPTTGDTSNSFAANTAMDPTARPGEIKVTPKLGTLANSESGMLINLNTGDPEQFWSILTLWTDSNTNCYFLANSHAAADIDLLGGFDVWRYSHPNLDSFTKLFKIYACLQETCAIYAEALMGDKAMKVSDKSFRAPYLGFTFDSDSYVITKIAYNFKTGICDFEADALGSSSPTISATNDVAEYQNSVDAVDDGTHKVSASAIYNHIRNQSIHINFSANGVSYIPMTDEKGVIHYVHLKIIKGRLLFDIDSLEPPN